MVVLRGFPRRTPFQDTYVPRRLKVIGVRRALIQIIGIASIAGHHRVVQVVSRRHVRIDTLVEVDGDLASVEVDFHEVFGSVFSWAAGMKWSRDDSSVSINLNNAVSFSCMCKSKT